MSDFALAALQEIKARTWFYEFALPDGSYTSTDVSPEILLIHTSRRDKLLGIIRDRVEQPHRLSAADLASHEGYYSLELGSPVSRRLVQSRSCWASGTSNTPRLTFRPYPSTRQWP
jgi:hypothetical protein